MLFSLRRHPSSIAARPWVAVLACMACLATAGGRRARAAGFASAEFGGEHGNVIATNPMALYFNPAGIAFSEGTTFYIAGVLALRRGTWDHPQAASEVPDPPNAGGADTGRARFSSIFGAPALGATTHLGQLTVGGAFYVPFGGRVSWDQNQKFAGDANFPQASDGVQRWTLTHGALTYLYATLGAAVRVGRVALGLTGNLIHSSIQTSQAKSFNPAFAVDPTSEGRIDVDASGTQASFGAGAMIEAIDRQLWLGVSYQAPPGLGPIRLTGTLGLDYQGASTRDDITYTQALPDIVRAGARFRPVATFELRLYGDLTRWSRFRTECLSIRGQPCAVSASGADATSGTTIQNLRRFWNDTYSIRAGVSTWLRPDIELYAGVGFETAATPDATLDPALPDAASVRIALGARFAVGAGWHLNGGLIDIQYFRRDNTGKSTLSDAELPTRRADGGGIYTLWLGLLHVSIEKQL